MNLNFEPKETIPAEPKRHIDRANRSSHPYIHDMLETASVEPGLKPRADMCIQVDVRGILTDAADVNEQEIEVDVQVGIITLSGSVPNRSMKKRAERLAGKADGYSEIQNNLQIEGLEPINTTDSENPCISS